MPDFTLTPDQETELNGFVAEMEQNNLSEEEISEVVNNYIAEKSAESYEAPESILNTVPETEEEDEIEEEEVFGPVEGTPEQIEEAEIEYHESIANDPLE